MQIHEVFGLEGANARAGQRQQGEYAASAAQSAEKLRQQGYGQLKPDLTVNQLISQVQNDPAAQQLVRTWTAQWPKIAATVPAIKPKVPTPPPAAAPAAPAQPLIIGGQRLDPNDPASAQIIAQARAQGKLTEQQTTQPDPDEYRKAFETWADDVVERTVRQPGVVERIKQSTEWAQQFDQAADSVVNSAADARQNTQAVQAYLTLAIAAARAAQQVTAPANRSTTTSGLNNPQANALAQVLGLDATDLTKLNAYIKKNNERINPNGTGSDSLDALLKAAKLL